MKYAIIIPTYNNTALTIACIESIAQNTEDYILLWVDDGSTDSHYNQVRKHLDRLNVPYKSFRNEKNEGFIKSANRGLQEALKTNAPYIILQNNDTIVYPRWIKELTVVIEKDEKIAAVGPLTVASVQSVEHLDHYYGMFPHEITSLYKNSEKEVFAQTIGEQYSGCYIKTYERIAFFCTLFRKEAIEDVGFLDEIYGAGYYDDDDYCERLLRSGWDLAIAYGVFVDHHLEKTFSKAERGVKWEEKRAEMFQKNKDLFDHKFHYGIYGKDLSTIADRRELTVRLAKKQKELQQANMRIVVMEQSIFWRMRSVYMRVKSFFGIS